MDKNIKSELEEQVLKAIANIENVIFSSDKFKVNSVNFNSDVYTNELMNLTLDIDLEPVKEPNRIGLQHNE